MLISTRPCCGADRRTCRVGVGAVEIHRVAFRDNAGAPDVDQHAALLRRGFRDGDCFGNAIRAL
jgi:hypothetical protein